MEVKRKGRRPINEEAFEKIRRAGNKEVLIKKEEWNLATPPGAHILRKVLNEEYQVNTLLDDSGWIIKMKRKTHGKKFKVVPKFK